MATKSMDFGQFMSTLAAQADGATKETLDGIQAKLQKQKQEDLERRLQTIFRDMESQVTRLREIRRMEKQVKKAMTELEARANRLVRGEDEFPED